VNLLRYTIADSSEIPVGGISGCTGILNDASAFNSNSGIYHFLGIDSSLGICLYSADTRSPVFSYTKLQLITGGISLNELEYDNETDELHALSFSDSTTPNLQIHAVNVSTGALTLEADFPGLNSYVMGTSCYDQTTGSYIFLGGDSSVLFQTCIYNTVSNTFQTGFLPSAILSEFQCDNFAYAQTKYGVTGTQLQTAGASFSVFPNPADHQLTIETAAGTSLMEIVNVSGQVMQSVSLNQGQNLIDISSIPAGIYWIRMQNAASAIQGARVVVF
jgi:hypothetical protein